MTTYVMLAAMGTRHRVTPMMMPVRALTITDEEEPGLWVWDGKDKNGSATDRQAEELAMHW
jgi:hypothetical protein